MGRPAPDTHRWRRPYDEVLPYRAGSEFAPRLYAVPRRLPNECYPETDQHSDNPTPHKRESWPARVIGLAVEWEEVAGAGGEMWVPFRYALVRYDRVPGEVRWEAREEVSVATPDEAVAIIDGWTIPGADTCVLLDRLTEQRMISAVDHRLSALGWELKLAMGAGDAAFVKLGRGKRRLYLLDRSRFTNASAKACGQGFGEAHGLALSAIGAWEHSRALGARKWGPTATSCAWNAAVDSEPGMGDISVMRRGPAFRRVLDGLTGGDVEAFRVGAVPGAVEEWDMRDAYPRIVIGEDLPVRLVNEHAYYSREEVLDGIPGHAILTDAYVHDPEGILATPAAGYVDGATARPLPDDRRMPTEAERLTFHAEGRKYATAWDFELREVVERGGDFHPLGSSLFTVGRPLAGLMRRLLDRRDACRRTGDSAGEGFLKMAGRGVCGRTAARRRVEEETAPLPFPYFGPCPIGDADGGNRQERTQWGTQAWVAKAETMCEGTNPAILSAIMARQRQRLRSLVREVGPEHVVYVDTDSVMLTGAGGTRMRLRPDIAERYALRVKTTHHDLVIYGPRNYRSRERRVAAGQTRGLRVTADEGETFVTLEAPSTGAGGLPGAGAVVRRHSVTVETSDHRRIARPDGSTVAWTVDEPPLHGHEWAASSLRKRYGPVDPARLWNPAERLSLSRTATLPPASEDERAAAAAAVERLCQTAEWRSLVEPREYQAQDLIGWRLLPGRFGRELAGGPVRPRDWSAGAAHIRREGIGSAERSSGTPAGSGALTRDTGGVCWVPPPPGGRRASAVRRQ